MKRFLSIPAVCLTFLFAFLATAAPAAERQKLIVGGDHENPPYEFIENGRPTGFNVELMRAVADAVGADVEFRLGPWSQVRADLEQGKIDALAGMYYSEERSRLIDFSVPHTLVTAGLFVRRGSPVRTIDDMKGKEVIVQKGDAIDDYLRKEGTASRIIEVEDPADVLRLLASGRHDCALMPSRFQGEYLLKSLGISNVRAMSANLTQLRYCFAVKKGNTPLKYRLDEGLNILKVNGKYKEIYNKWFGVYEKQRLWGTLRYFVWSLAIIAGLLAASSIWSWILRREVRKRTAELGESEEKFRVLAETSPAAICVYQGEHIIYCNAAMMGLTGYTEPELKEMRFWEWMHEDYRELARERGLARQRGEQVPSHYEIKFITKRGEVKWLFLSAGQIEYKGKPAGIVTMFDITDRKQMEEELQYAHDDLEMQVEERTAELCRANESLEEEIIVRNRTERVITARLRLLEFAATHSLDELLEATINEAEALTDSSIGFYHFLDADQKTLLLQNWSTRAKAEFRGAEGAGIHRDISEAGVWLDCIRERRPVINNDYASLAHRKGLPPWHADVIRELVVPVFRGDSIVAIIWVGNKPQDYTAEDVEAVSFLSDLSWEIAERKQAEEALHLSQFCIDKAAIGIFQISLDDGKFLRVNDSLCRSHGYSSDELCTMSIFDLNPSLTWEKFVDFKRTVDQSGSMTYETVVLRKDGTLFPVEVTANNLVFRDKTYGICFVQDITERRQAEESLKRAKEEWERTFASVPDLIAILDDQYRIVRVNKAMAKRLGVTTEECVGLHCYEAIHGMSDPPAFCPHLETMKDGRKHFMEIHEERLGGDFQVSTIPLNDERGVMVGSVHIAYDITERKRAEEALKESEQRYRTVADYTYGWEYWIAPDGLLNYVSPSCARISGYSAEEFIANPGLLIEIVHPEDRPKIERHLLDVSNGESCPVPHEEDFRIICKDGSERWVAHACQQVFAADGRYLGRRASNRDITDRKQADVALRESESRVRRKLESILDPEGDIGELDLADIIDAPEIQALMEDLYRASGLKMSILDPKGEALLIDAGWQEICKKFHRVHPETRERCRESDTDLLVGIPPGEFRKYKCKNNMWHLVTPIFVGGRHMGNLFISQFFFENEKIDYDLFRAEARKYGFPEEEYIAALEAVPRYSEEFVDLGKSLFLRLVDMLSKLSYGNIKLARLLAERDRLAETLREREALLKLAMDLAKMGAWEYDAGTGQFTFDDQFYALYGTTVEREGGPLMPAEVYARKFIPPEESSVVADGIEHMRTNSNIQVEHRIIRADGEERFIIVRGEAVFDQEGRFVKIRGANQDITERKLAEDAVLESRAKYQAIVDNFEGYIYICSQDYRVEFMNKKLIERTGYDATGEFCYKVMHERDSVCPWCVNERVFAGETVQWEMFSPKDNRWFYVVNVPIPHSDGTISKQSMMLDITERKLAEEELRRANMVVENSPVVVFRCKAAPGWPVEMVSKNVVLFGYEPEEFLSGELTYSSIVYSRDLEKLIAETEEHTTTGKDLWFQEYRIVTKEGDIRWIIDETDCVRNEDGDVTHYEGVIIDITERRKAEEQLILQQIQLRELNKTLEERVRDEVAKNREKDIMLIQQNRMAALGEMFDHIAHQWKQPLNSIAVIIQTLGSISACEQVTTEQITETVDNIMDMVAHMAQTVEVFRNFYRPDKEKSAFLIKESIENALSFIKPSLRRNQTEVRLDIDPQLSAVGYPKEYAQVLLNILANANEIFKERGVEKPVLDICAFADGNRAVVTITDNGGGIAEDDIGKIFDLYFTTKASSGGTGLGLYMSRNIIEKNMSGILSAKNVEDGTQFRIEVALPVVSN